MTVKGAIVASAVAGLFAAATPAVVHAKDAGKVKCSGINDCKGKGACKSATSSCKGMNDCKGKGWVESSAKECRPRRAPSSPRSNCRFDGTASPGHARRGLFHLRVHP